MTTATSEATLDAERYLKDVAPHLGGLPEEERAELLDDLAQHLREIAAEDGPPLRERLGPPEAYAAELLASAGVATSHAARPGPVARIGAVVERARDSTLGREMTRLAPVLRPTWWVARAYLAVLLVATVEGHGYRSSGNPVPRLAGNPAVGLLAVAVAVPLSVRLGQRPRRGRLAGLAGNAVLAVFALSLLSAHPSSGADFSTPYPIGPDGSNGCLATSSGEPITNLYAYDTDGRLLDPVLLYDQAGRPIDNLCPEVDGQGRPLSTGYRSDVNGAPVTNAFPRRQSAFVTPGPGLPETGFPRTGPTVPVLPPAVVVPRLAPTTTTPPTTSTTPGG
ncbi:MAG: DUF1700 domain-containing protein [Actinomycetota bacterium]|nr:DUF1700 domain-containing protein [Actinomycetota bacterium]